MVKTITGSFGQIHKAAQDRGIVVGLARTEKSHLDADILLQSISTTEVVVRSKTLAGDLFLSLLVIDACG